MIKDRRHDLAKSKLDAFKAKYTGSCQKKTLIELNNLNVIPDHLTQEALINQQKNVIFTAIETEFKVRNP